MRILFTTWAAPSHLYPMVPLAWAFQAAGHQVRVAAPPNCEQAITRAGLAAVPVGPVLDVTKSSTGGKLAAWHSQGSWPDDWPLRAAELEPDRRGILRALGEKQVRIAGAMTADLLAHARDWRPDLVVHDAGTYAGAIVAALLDVPAFSQMWGSSAVLQLERTDLDGELLPGYRELFERFGADPERRPEAWLDSCPPGLTLPSPVPRLPVRFVPYNGPGAQPDWLRGAPERPRVCLTLGVTADKLRPGAALPAPVLIAAERLVARGAEVVLAVTAAQHELLGPLPDGVRAVGGLPLSLLLPTCRAIAHQGGGGTTMTATLAGRPQLVIAPRPEQMLAGARLAAAGAGRRLAVNELADGPEGGELLADEVSALLDEPGYAAAAERLRAEMLAMPTPAELVPVLLAAARRGVPAAV
ncbi:nucleotide disphospho-sugar-binding domain-containing protein [Kitasatospora sp. NPDC088391]|uniref:nucleotide disphospho-sugar-binding domain-containing protein n=1 Tax=Kitasatospora sp. NPDC088391 TaxID=3364074 RepID=UPI00380D51AB